MGFGETLQTYGPAISAGLQAGGDYLQYRGQQQTNATNAQMMREQNLFNSTEADKARAYNTEMSNTSWQRGVADMRAAGLNPALAFQQGGASTPSSPSASASATPRMENAAAGLGGTAAAVATTMANIAQTRANIQATNASARKTQAEAEGLEIENQLDAPRLRTEGLRIGNTRTGAEIPGIRARGRLDEEGLPANLELIRARLGQVITNAAESGARTELTRAQLPEAKLRAQAWQAGSDILNKFLVPKMTDAYDSYKKTKVWGFGKEAIQQALNNLWGGKP